MLSADYWKLFLDPDQARHNVIPADPDPNSIMLIVSDKSDYNLIVFVELV